MTPERSEEPVRERERKKNVEGKTGAKAGRWGWGGFLELREPQSSWAVVHKGVGRG